MGTEEPAKDKAATEPPAKDRSSGGRDDAAEDHGGPRGNPNVDEEALRKKQEEAARRPG